MKHKNLDKIIAKASNMDLVVFVNLKEIGEWWVTDMKLMLGEGDADFFLCLPQHKEACLHWLNGGVSQVEYTKASYPYWCNIETDEVNWSGGHIFMDELLSIRIKPKKEKRWIGYCASRNQVIPHAQDSKQLAINYTALHYSYHVDEWKFIEIEVEV